MPKRHKRKQPTPERYGSATVRGTQLERRAKNASHASIPIQQFKERVDIFITVYRKRTGDPDNICTKSEIDAIVALGIIADDSARYVRWVCTQERPAKENGGKEETIITLTEIRK